MTREIAIEASPEETRVAVIENGKCAEIHVERAADRSLVGNVYLGRVDRVIPGMQSAFVDVGLERHAFLHVTDVLPLDDAEADADAEQGPGPDDEPVPKVAAEQPIEKLLRAGQDIVVQVTREPIGTKGARVTTHVTLPGKLVVYMPLSDHVGVSRRILDESTRDRLRRTLAEVQGRVEGGAIVRTDAADAPPEALESELIRLRDEWLAARACLRGATPPRLLREDAGVALRILRDAQAADVARVVVEGDEAFQRIASWVQACAPALAPKTSLHSGPAGLFETLGLEREIDKALRDRAWLKSGGYLVINQIEALVAIDVNTGKFTGDRKLDETILQVNLEAAREAARQLRLRDLGGIVVIDFIDMSSDAHRQAVLRELESTLARDRARTTVLGMSEFGLVQLTRQRQRRSLDRALLEPCPSCGGSGRVKSAETLANAVLRRVRRQPGATARLRAHPELAEAVQRKVEAAATAGQPLACRLEISADTSLERGAFDLAT